MIAPHSPKMLGLPMVTSALDFVLQCGVPLHPTGSRVFGKAHQNSDYDFIVEDHKNNRKFFLDNGFHECMHEGYCDPCTSIVMQKENVHIQFCHSLKVKLLAQKVLFADFRNRDFLYAIAKEDRKKIWSIAIAGVLAGMHSDQNK